MSPSPDAHEPDPQGPDASLLHEPPGPTAGQPTSPHTAHLPPAYGQPGYGPPGYPPPAYGPPGYPPAPVATGAAALQGADERNWAVAAHLSGLLAGLVGLWFLGPLVVLLAAGNRSPYVRAHAVEALNFGLSVLLWSIVAAVSLIVLVGFLLLPLLAVAYLVCSVLAATAAARGEHFRYPLTIRFVS